MGADAYFNDSSAWMHYYPADTCVGEEDDTVYRCSDDGYMLYRYLFAEAGCSGSASVQVLNVTAGAAEVGSNFFVDCSCSSESNHYIEARAFADSNCTTECGSESASCNSSVATFLSGTVVQMVVSGNSYNDDDSMDWTYGGNSSYGGYGSPTGAMETVATVATVMEAMAMETAATATVAMVITATATVATVMDGAMAMETVATAMAGMTAIATAMAGMAIAATALAPAMTTALALAPAMTTALALAQGMVMVMGPALAPAMTTARATVAGA